MIAQDCLPSCLLDAAGDPEFVTLANRWLRLPKAIRAGISAMVRASDNL